ncbi:methionine aminopeptidase 1B, chloroplastic-like isoform X2 [Aristolochia californica]|uniref:methionine aminopeptidase 1B, chloroplastic-like isoform X2 n=1 Tax=Aristolochia californica TaxID=171875 RepID=UPI0035DF4A90
MALSAPLSMSSLHCSSSFITGETLSSSVHVKGVPLNFSDKFFPGRKRSEKQVIIISKRLSGLEEAMRIRRERELRNAKKTKRQLLRHLSPEHQIHDAEGIACMRAVGELAARVLDYAGTLVRPSITTNEIDKAVHQMIIDAGAYPSPLGYGGFPKSVCTSVNECMCHGIPDSRQLQDGDIINIDVTVYLNGYHGDTSRTFLCGNVNEEARRLVQVTEECLEKAISVCKDGVSFKKIGKRISEHAEKYGYGVVERFVGHGVGKIFHSEPIIIHNRNEMPGRMVEGQTFTIEPILTMGSIDCVMWEDGWTTLTADGGLAAQVEHTLLITRKGAEILTKY